MVDLSVAAVTVIGQKHRQRGVPCEDASIAVTSNGVTAVVVADGAGSKQYTHARFGSAAAVKTIADLLTEHFDALYNENREAAVRSLIIAALHVKFADLIVEPKLDSIERLSCTLLFCAVKDRRMLVGHIGDGLIVKVTPSGVSPLTMPQNGASSSSTYFVTANHAADYLRLIKTTVDDVHAVALMTDGVQDSVYDENTGLIKPVVARMADTLSAGRQKAEAELKGIIEKFVVGSSNNSDDASFGVIYFGGTKGPDPKSLPNGAERFGRATETFKDLQTSLVPEVKRAKKIIVEAAANAPVMLKEEEKPAKKTGETENDAAKENESKKISVRPVIKKSSILMWFIVIMELAAIVWLILKLYILKV